MNDLRYDFKVISAVKFLKRRTAFMIPADICHLFHHSVSANPGVIQIRDTRDYRILCSYSASPIICDVSSTIAYHDHWRCFTWLHNFPCDWRCESIIHCFYSCFSWWYSHFGDTTYTMRCCWAHRLMTSLGGWPAVADCYCTLCWHGYGHIPTIYRQ